MTSWVGQYCIYVRDLDESVRFYEALGLENTSRTDLDGTREAIVENPGHGGKLQLADKVGDDGPIDMGNAFWKLYVATDDIEQSFEAAKAAGADVVAEPVRLERWPMSIAFVTDPSGYLVELTQRHPWKEEGWDATGQTWLNQYCLYVSDIERTVAFYETLGLTCTSRTEIPGASEAIVEHPRRGGRIQLAQKVADDGPIDMGGAMWKLYIHTDDCARLHARAVEAGYSSVVGPMKPERWPVTIAFLADPDGYQVELVERLGTNR